MPARYVYAVISLLVLTAGYACWCRAPLIWDGAYQLSTSLIMQYPYGYLTRFHTYILWWPVVWASRHTANITLLSTLYGLPFLLAPVVAVWMSWWMVKKEAPHLILWPIFGVAAGALPGQIFVINDSIFQLHLFWPILMSLFVTLSMRKRTALLPLVVFQFVHQIGVGLFLGATILAVVLAWADAKSRRRWLIRATMMLSLFCLAMSKYVLTNVRPPSRDMGGMIFCALGAVLFIVVIALSFPRWANVVSVLLAVALVVCLHRALQIPAAHPDETHKLAIDNLLDTYALEQSSLKEILNAWGSGVNGWPIRGLGLMWASALLALIHRTRERASRETVRGTTTIGLYSLLFAALGMACWVHWASDGALWWKALDYRRFVVPLTTPFFIMLMLEACFSARSRRRQILNETTDAEAGVPPAPLDPMARRPTTTAEMIDPPPLPLRGPLALLLGATFALVLGIQSTVWHDMSGRLYNEVVAYPDPIFTSIVPKASMPWADQSPLAHWGIQDFVMLLQGKNPRRLFLYPDVEKDLYGGPTGHPTPRIPRSSFYPSAPEPGSQGWYDLRDVIARQSAGQVALSALTGGMSNVLSLRHFAVHDAEIIYDRNTTPD